MIEVVRMTGRPRAAAAPLGGTPIAQAVGLAAAVDYLSELGMDQIAAHEQEITSYALAGLATLPGEDHRPTESVDREGAVSAPDGDGTRSIRTTPARCWTRSESPFAAGTTTRPLHERFGIQSSTRRRSTVRDTCRDRRPDRAWTTP
jgi:cysteine desulfurase/selenocysteine lyase